MTEPRTTQGFSFSPLQSCSTPKSAVGVACDLCGYGMQLPQHCADRGEVIGLLTCSACVEDALAARQLETGL